jgi:Na+/citrate or Na+/malate symporter
MSEQAVILKDIVDSIPYYNYMLLKFVMELMNELSLFPEETQMNSENLAKIISPNLIWKEIVNIEDMSLVDDALKGNQLANTMIVHFKEIFTR